MATKPIPKANTAKVSQPIPSPAAATAPQTASKATVVRRTADARPTRSKADREGLIAQAAYLMAERRGFAESDSVADWLVAEREIDTTWRFE
jgi:hypothetical protein